MLKKFLFTIVCVFAAIVSINAQNSDMAMILPFENASNKAEFNWVGESFADSLSDLLKVPGMNVITNQERKIIQQRLRVPLTTLPSLATSLKLARDGRATLLIAGKYEVQPAQGDSAATIRVTAKIIRVNEGRFLSDEFNRTREIAINDALGNLQNVQGEIAYVILYQLLKAQLTSSRNDIVGAANKVPARAFEAYIKGLLTSEADGQTRENFLKNALRIYAEDEKTKGGVYSDAALELGHLFLNQKKFAEAITFFSQVPTGGSQYAEAAFYTGLIHWQQQNYEQALAVLRPLAEDLKLTSVYNTLGAIAVQAARADKKNKGNADKLMLEGLDFLKKAATESAGDDLNAKFNYSLALYLNNDFTEAGKQLRLILVNNSRDGEAYFLLAKTVEREKPGDATIADFDNQARRFLTENNRYAKLETDWKAGKTDGINLRVEQPARKDFVSVVLIKKQSAPVQSALNETDTLLAEAQTFYKNGKDDEAMPILRKVLVSEPMSAQAYLLLGMIHLRRGDSEQAVSSLKTALFWDNRLIEAHITLGKIYVQKGDCQSAQTYSASAATIDAENQEVTGLKRMVERCSTK